MASHSPATSILLPLPLSKTPSPSSSASIITTELPHLELTDRPLNIFPELAYQSCPRLSVPVPLHPVRIDTPPERPATAIGFRYRQRAVTPKDFLNRNRWSITSNESSKTMSSTSNLTTTDQMDSEDDEEEFPTRKKRVVECSEAEKIEAEHTESNEYEMIQIPLDLADLGSLKEEAEPVESGCTSLITSRDSSPDISIVAAPAIKPKGPADKPRVVSMPCSLGSTGLPVGSYGSSRRRSIGIRHVSEISNSASIMPALDVEKPESSGEPSTSKSVDDNKEDTEKNIIDDTRKDTAPVVSSQDVEEPPSITPPPVTVVETNLAETQPKESNWVTALKNRFSRRNLKTDILEHPPTARHKPGRTKFSESATIDSKKSVGTIRRLFSRQSRSRSSSLVLSSGMVSDVEMTEQTTLSSLVSAARIEDTHQIEHTSNVPDSHREDAKSVKPSSKSRQKDGDSVKTNPRGTWRSRFGSRRPALEAISENVPPPSKATGKKKSNEKKGKTMHGAGPAHLPRHKKTDFARLSSYVSKYFGTGAKKELGCQYGNGKEESMIELHHPINPHIIKAKESKELKEKEFEESNFKKASGTGISVSAGNMEQVPSTENMYLSRRYANQDFGPLGENIFPKIGEGSLGIEDDFSMHKPCENSKRLSHKPSHDITPIPEEHGPAENGPAEILTPQKSNSSFRRTRTSTAPVPMNVRAPRRSQITSANGGVRMPRNSTPIPLARPLSSNAPEIPSRTSSSNAVTSYSATKLREGISRESSSASLSVHSSVHSIRTIHRSSSRTSTKTTKSIAAATSGVVNNRPAGIQERHSSTSSITWSSKINEYDGDVGAVRQAGDRSLSVDQKADMQPLGYVDPCQLELVPSLTSSLTSMNSPSPSLMDMIASVPIVRESLELEKAIPADEPTDEDPATLVAPLNNQWRNALSMMGEYERESVAAAARLEREKKYENKRQRMSANEETRKIENRRQQKRASSGSLSDVVRNANVAARNETAMDDGLREMCMLAVESHRVLEWRNTSGTAGPLGRTPAASLAAVAEVGESEDEDAIRTMRRRRRV